MAGTKLDYATLCDVYGIETVTRQIELEERMAGLGNEAFHRRINEARQGGNESGTRYGQHLLAKSIDPVAEGITAFVAEANSGRPGVAHSAVKYLENVDPHVAALLTMRVVLDGVISDRTLQSVAIRVADRIETENRARYFSEENPGASGRITKKIKKATTERHKTAILGSLMKKTGVEWKAWPKIEKLHLGLRLIDIAIEHTGFVEVFERSIARNKTVKYVTASDESREWIEKQVNRSEMLTPLYLPTIMPPASWTNTRDGGYHTFAMPQDSLIKTRHEGYLDELDDRADDMPVVYQSVNALQRTAWTVNTDVLSVAKDLWELGHPLAKLPARDDIPSVPCAKCGRQVELGMTRTGRRDNWAHECFEENEEALKAWKKEAAKIHEKNRSVRSQRLLVQRTVWTAEMFESEKKIYFPYTLDFRGRIYAVSAFSPQGNDLTKGLLTFADGKPIDDGVAAGWLAIQVANTFGEDKISLEDRISWVEEREEWLRAIADDPLGTVSVWGHDKKGADKPWQFLAAVLEWVGFLNEGYGYISRLPIALDGSCSGIQHFSAMLRDEVGGKAVNLIPSDKPSDIYAEVAKVVREKLRLKVCQGADEMAGAMLDLDIDRSATKRQVMTLPYGATTYSCRKYTETWLREKRGDVLPWQDDSEVFAASCYLSDIIWESIGEVVIAARSAMSWLQSGAKVVAAEGLPVTWTTPTGFPILQAYPSMKRRRVKSRMGDQILKLSLREEQDEIDRAQMAAGISPNFVHSMDAAHLMLSVELAEANGVSNFSMIHDSFGTHAADTEMLGTCLRQAFVTMYETNDVLSQFREALLGQVYSQDSKKKLRKTPPKGSLDLASVQDSDFFFA